MSEFESAGTTQSTGAPNRRRRLAPRAGALAAAVVCLAAAPASSAPTATPAPPNPKADPAAVVVQGNARFTVLTPDAIRIEYAPDGKFEDRASLAIINRRLPVPAFDVKRRGKRLEIDTGNIRLVYRDTGTTLTAENLSIRYDGPRGLSTWKPGTPDKGNLRGTTRTLDGVSGATTLEFGLLSRDGWVLVDDSQRPLLTSGDKPWVAPRADSNPVDWYFLAYGNDYSRALQDFTLLAGRVPLPPRYVFGAWWSRYWAYTDQEFKDLVAEFASNDVPLDVLVIDMDWHLDGWTGYTWNPKYFPDPAGFLRWTEEQGLAVTLNLHPADGVKKHEAAYPDMARAMGIDPTTGQTVKFDATNPRFIDAYFKYLHHPLEDMGVDFWWMDWQQERTTKVRGLDPLTWLNYLHWVDMERRADSTRHRPLIFSRWGGLGGHRWPIGFSGDTYCNWQSLAFQPYFTATAGNVLYSYWSHDIGGHQPGPVAPELYTRWIQWAVFNPVLRTHGTKNENAERRIWAFPPEYFEASRRAFHLRYALVPYIYTAARQTYDSAKPLVRPLYHEWPKETRAYDSPGQYLFGDSMLVNPVVEPRHAETLLTFSSTWLPPGEMWVNRLTGELHPGGTEAVQLVSLEDVPVFLRGGAVIPMAPKGTKAGDAALDSLILEVWPGGNAGGQLYEDDGISAGYLDGAFRFTRLRSSPEADGGSSLRIGAVEGTFEGAVANRSYEVRFRDTPPPAKVVVNGETLAWRTGDTAWDYDAETFTTIVRLADRAVAQTVDVKVTPRANAELPNGFRGQVERLRRAERVLGGTTTKTDALMARLVSGSPPMLAPDASTHAEELFRQLLARTTDGSVPEQTRLQALALLLGLNMTASAVGVEDDVIEVEVNVMRTLAGADWSGEVTLDVPEGWRAQGDGKPQRIRNLAVGRPVPFRWRLRAETAGNTSILAAAVNLQAADMPPVSLPARLPLLPSINRWWVVGPFPVIWNEAMDTTFSPETEPIDLGKSYTGKAGTRAIWKEVRRRIGKGEDLGSELFVNLHRVFAGHHLNAVAYAVTWVESPDDREAVLALGSDDGAAVRLNGEWVFRNPKGRAFTSREDRVPVRLKRGRNELLLKVTQGDAEWGFAAHLEDAGGRPMTDVRIIAGPRP